MESASITSYDDSVVSAQTEARGGVIVTNQVQATADALVRSSSVTTDASGTGGLLVHAAVKAEIAATALTKAASSDTVGVIIALNTVGWAADNILFTLIDALLGSSYLTTERPVSATAHVLDSTVDVAGDVSVLAESSAAITAELGNDQVALAVNEFVIRAKYNAKSSATGAALASNKVSSRAQASIDNTSGVGTVDAGGAVTVSATDNASIDAHSKVAVSATSQNNLNAVKGILSTFFPSTYQYTTASGTQVLRTGDRVRLGASYAGGGDTGAVYKYTGSNGVSLDLGMTNYSTGPWHKITGGDDDIADLFPNIGNLTASDAEALGGLVVVNDARGGAEAFIRNQHVTAASIAVSATEDASIRAFVETNVSASGGSAFGAGSVLAVNGQIVTNIVLSSADAYVEDSILTTTGGGVSIVAQTTSGIDATLDSALSTGDTGVGITLAFNSIGWKPSNILFNAVDALLGDPLISSAFNGEQPAATTASVTGLDDHGGRRRDGQRRQRRAAQLDRLQRRRLRRLRDVRCEGQERRRHPREQQGLDARLGDHRRRDDRRRRRRGGAPPPTRPASTRTSRSSRRRSPRTTAARRCSRTRSTTSSTPTTPRRSSRRTSRSASASASPTPRRPTTSRRAPCTSGWARTAPQDLTTQDYTDLGVLEAGQRDDPRAAGPQLHAVGLGRRRRRDRAQRRQQRGRRVDHRRDGRRRPASPSRRSEAATIIATNDVTATSSGGSTLHRPGPVARRRRRHRDEPHPQLARPRSIDGADVTTTAGDVAVSATNTSPIEADDAARR